MNGLPLHQDHRGECCYTLVLMQHVWKVRKAVLQSYMQLRQLPASPEAPAGGDFSVEVVHIQAAAVQDGVGEVVGRHILDAPAAVEGAQVLQEVLLHQAEPVQTSCADTLNAHAPCIIRAGPARSLPAHGLPVCMS